MRARGSLLRQALTLVAIAVLTAPLVPVAFLIGDGQPVAWDSLQEMILGLSAISAPMILIGATFLGLPALIAARQLGMTASLAKLALVGGTTGAVAAPTIFGLLSWRVPSEIYAQLALTGALVGSVGSCLWWLLIEKYRAQVVE